MNVLKQSELMSTRSGTLGASGLATGVASTKRPGSGIVDDDDLFSEDVVLGGRGDSSTSNRNYLALPSFSSSSSYTTSSTSSSSLLPRIQTSTSGISNIIPEFHSVGDITLLVIENILNLTFKGGKSDILLKNINKAEKLVENKGLLVIREDLKDIKG
jgi:hypothetical protein